MRTEMDMHKNIKLIKITDIICTILYAINLVTFFFYSQRYDNPLFS